MKKLIVFAAVVVAGCAIPNQALREAQMKAAAEQKAPPPSYGAAQDREAAGEAATAETTASIYERLWDNDEGTIPPLLLTGGGAEFVLPPSQGQQDGPKLQVAEIGHKMPPGRWGARSAAETRRPPPTGATNRVVLGYGTPGYMLGAENGFAAGSESFASGMTFGLYLMQVQQDSGEGFVESSFAQSFMAPSMALNVEFLFSVPEVPGQFQLQVPSFYFGVAVLDDRQDWANPIDSGFYFGVGFGGGYSYDLGGAKVGAALRYLIIPSVSDLAPYAGGLFATLTASFGGGAEGGGLK